MYMAIPDPVGLWCTCYHRRSMNGHSFKCSLCNICNTEPLHPAGSIT